MTIGDLVVCHCQLSTWYKGTIGLLIGFSECTRDPVVMYSNGITLRLAKSGLEVINEGR